MKFSQLAALFTVFVLLITVGCNTIYSSAVTLTEVEDAVMRQWARLHNDRLTTADIDMKVNAAHENFNKARITAAIALRAYQAGGDKANYIKALEAARAAINPLFEILQPLLTAESTKKLKSQALNATKP